MRFGSFKNFRLVMCLLLVPLLGAGDARPAALRILTTPHYRIHTDLDPRLAEDLAQRIDAMHAQYTLRLADFSPNQKTAFDVYLFNNKEDYARLTENRFPNTAGIFVQSRNLLAAFFEGQGRDAMRRTLQHEAFHQFAYTAIGPKLPVWLNEGIAQVFEEGLWAGNQFSIGQVPPRRIRQLEEDMRARRFMPLDKFLAITDKQWSADLNDASLAASRYCEAWAVTHFLIFATDDAGQPRYRARLIRMLRLIHDGTNPDDAFRQAFSDNFAGFQQRFVEYVSKLAPTRDSTYMEYQSILADMLVLLDEQRQHFDDPDSFRQFLSQQGTRLRYAKGQSQWSTASDPNVYFRDDDGRVMTREQFFFSIRGGAPLPDVVCRPIDGLQFRTIFHTATGRVDHETIIERY